MEAAARQLGLKLQMITVKDIGALAAAFDAAKRGRAEALVFALDGVLFNNLAELLERARALQVPVISPVSLAAEMGALVFLGHFRSERRTCWGATGLLSRLTGDDSFRRRLTLMSSVD